jgi:mitochondrial fission protein ELM1
MSSPPRIWTLTDGRTGNLRQVQALADALGGAARDWRLSTAMPWRWLAPRELPGSASAFGTEFGNALATRSALASVLAIGCGRQAALATRLLREEGARSVQILDPRIDPRHWDVVIAPEHDRLRGDNVITLCGSLHPVDASWLEAARHMHPRIGELPSPRTLLLLGGPLRQVPLDTAWWRETASLLEATIQRDGGSLLISGSRRTPGWLQRAVRAWLPRMPGMRWFGDSDGPNPYPGLLAWADRIVVTPDSVNLISEACATTAPVHLAANARVRGRHARFLDALIDRGRARRLQDLDVNWPIVPLVERPRVVAAVRSRLAR